MDRDNTRVLKFAPGAGTGEVVAGGNGAGNALAQLHTPQGFVVDNGNVYVADTGNNRVVVWGPGGVTDRA